MDIAINYFAVLGAAVVAYAIGAVWYSPVGFQKQWMHMMGMTKDSMRHMALSPMQAMAIGFVTTLLFAYVLAHFMVYVGANTLSLALQMGFWVWLGFVATTLAGTWLWEGKPLKLFLFNAAYQLVSVSAMAAVLSWLM